MKKAYVKPVMESEAFVANEYVAACWTVTCTKSGDGCGFITGKGDYPSGLSVNDLGLGTYVGKIGSKDPGCTDQFVANDYEFEDGFSLKNILTFLKWLRDYFNNDLGTTTWHHPVSVENEWPESTGHPYASV